MRSWSSTCPRLSNRQQYQLQLRLRCIMETKTVPGSFALRAVMAQMVLFVLPCKRLGGAGGTDAERGRHRAVVCLR
jgi:hypothetical protein